MMAVADSSTVSMPLYWNTRRHRPADRHHYLFRLLWET